MDELTILGVKPLTNHTGEQFYPKTTTDAVFQSDSETGHATETTLTQILYAKADKASEAISGNFAGLDANGNLTDSGKKASDFATVIAVNNIEQLTSEQVEGLEVGDVVSAREFGTLTQIMVNFTVHSKSVESCRLESMSRAQAIEVAYTKENNLWVFEYSRVMTFEDLADIDLSNLSGDGEARFDAKADKVSEATNGNFAGLDSNGNLTDSGSKATDFATASQGAKADTAIQTITVGTTTTGAAGTDASVTNSGTATNPVLNFTIPRGTNGQDGEDAYNPFKGTYLITDTLPTTGQAGDYIYVVDSQTPPVTHLYAWDGTAFSDTTETVTMGDSQFANSTKPISQTNVVNDLKTGGADDVLSAEQGKVIDTAIGRVGEYVNMTDLVQGGITGSEGGIPNNSTRRVRTKYFLTGHIKVETSDDIVFIEYIYNLDGTYSVSTVEKTSDEINNTTKLYVIVFKNTGNTDVTPDYVKERVTFNSVVKDIVDLNTDITDLNGDVDNIQSDLEQLQSDFDEINGKLITKYPYLTIGSPRAYVPTMDTTGLSVITNISDLYDAYDALAAAHPDFFAKEIDLGMDASNTYYIRHYTIRYQSPNINSNDDLSGTNYWDDADIKPRHIILNSGTHGLEKESVYGCYLAVKSILESNEPFARYLRDNFVIDVVPCLNPWGFENDNRYNSNNVNINRDFSNSSPQSETVAMKSLISSLIDKGLVAIIDSHNCNFNNGGYLSSAEGFKYYELYARTCVQLQSLLYSELNTLFGNTQTHYFLWTSTNQGTLWRYTASLDLLGTTCEISNLKGEAGSLITKAIVINLMQLFGSYSGK